MNAFLRIIPVSIVLLSLTLFSSCYKIYDYVKQHPGSEVDVCQVKYLVDGPDTVTVHYNAAGNPIDMVRNHLGTGSWQSDKVFRYDNKERLTDYIWATKGSSYRLIWHRYSYPRKSIVTDSLFAYINDGTAPNPPIQNFNGLTIDSLDTEGRVVKTISDPYGDAPFITNFVYNAQGNVVLPNSVYDNKLSILHTNKVWMFLNNDYSVNNRLSRDGGLLQVSKYNQAGLPLDFSVVPGNHGSDVLFVTIGNKLMITYDCD